MKQKILIVIIFLIISNSLGFAQLDTLRPRYGAFVGMSLNSHSSNFSQLPGVENCCPEFSDASGIGATFGGLYQLPLSNEILIGTRLGIYNRSGDFSSIETTYFADGLNRIQGQFEHTIETSLSILNLEPYISYRFWEDAFAHFGFNAGIFMGKSFSQKEEIIAPNNKGVFEDTGTRIRNEKSGDIDQLSGMAVALSIGLSYDFQLNAKKTLIISPELFYSYGINSNISTDDWKTNSLRLGVSLAYTPHQPQIQKSNEYFIDTVEKEVFWNETERIALGEEISKLTIEDKGDIVFHLNKIYRTDTLLLPGLNPADTLPYKDIVKKVDTRIEIIGYDEDKEKINFSEIKLNVILTKEIYPFLPYIFFDENSSDIPIRYNRIKSPTEFDENELNPSPIAYHRNNLNIIGKRLLENLNAKITVKGFVDPTTETDKCELAMDRAMSVKYYLVNTFKIDENRIIIESGKKCYPKDITRTKLAEGYAENRRVEIESDDSALLFAVLNARYENPSLISPREIEINTNEKVITSESITYKHKPELNSNTVSEADVDFWKMKVNQDKLNLLTQEGSGKTPSFPIGINKNNTRKLVSGRPLVIDFFASTADGKTASASKNIVVRKDTNEVEIETLTLTVFGVSQTTLDARLKKEISGFISTLKGDSEIRIVGFSDILGDAVQNKTLSLYRADEIRKYIRQIAPSAKITIVEGVGADAFPPGVNSYDSPEERFISRTVAIEIRKKLVR